MTLLTLYIVITAINFLLIFYHAKNLDAITLSDLIYILCYTFIPFILYFMIILYFFEVNKDAVIWRKK